MQVAALVTDIHPVDGLAIEYMIKWACVDGHSGHFVSTTGKDSTSLATYLNENYSIAVTSDEVQWI